MVMNGNVWVAFPSAETERAKKAVDRWEAKGYHTAVFYDSGKSMVAGEIRIVGIYRGYWAACNYLTRFCLRDNAEIVVFAADDIDPDPRFSAEELGAEFKNRFPNLFGVMQPCGDHQGIDGTGKPAAARICGSPWLGRSWIERAYGGLGPTNEDYFHFYGDEELFHVASLCGVLWMRPEITQFHRHWSWGHSNQTEYQKRNSDEYWVKDQAHFFSRKERGFPRWQPTPIEQDTKV